jgi:hypothetical protein
MKFGSYAREDATLALVHRRGALSLKVLARNANLESTDVSAGPPPEQDIPLNVPKKTKLYVEQTEREREQAGDMHRVFQRELCKLRLKFGYFFFSVVVLLSFIFTFIIFGPFCKKQHRPCICQDHHRRSWFRVQ